MDDPSVLPSPVLRKSTSELRGETLTMWGECVVMITEVAGRSSSGCTDDSR